MSNRSVDVGYSVGSAAQDQIADLKRVRLSTGEEAAETCTFSIRLLLLLVLLDWTLTGGVSHFAQQESQCAFWKYTTNRKKLFNPCLDTKPSGIFEKLDGGHPCNALLIEQTCIRICRHIHDGRLWPSTLLPRGDSERPGGGHAAVWLKDPQRQKTWESAATGNHEVS